MTKQTQLFLKKGREESLLRFHPWVFSGAVQRIEGELQEGDVVAVYANDGSVLGFGHYQVGSSAVRMLGFGAVDFPEWTPDGWKLGVDFWTARLQAAREVRLRTGILTDQTNCYRLVHGEGDGLPGLIIDMYDGVAVLQAHSAGMFLARHQIAEALVACYGDALLAVYDKSEGTAPFKAGLDLKDGYLYNRDVTSGTMVLEQGHRFWVDWEKGQKTGFFLDQRDNRHRVGELAVGRKVLNLFCYTGGFSIYALAAGATEVTSVDSSKVAMELVERNVQLNFDPSIAARHRGLCTDAIDYLKTVPKGYYDLIVVDPPAFAKHRGALSNALRAYQRLNAAAIERVAPGGFVFTYSCSQVVDQQAFSLAVFSAAAQTGRKVRILDRLNQPADHPVNIYHPEGSYLKGLLLYVE